MIQIFHPRPASKDSRAADIRPSTLTALLQHLNKTSRGSC